MSSVRNRITYEHYFLGRQCMRVVVIAITLLLTSCGWQERLRFSSPDKSSLVRVLSPYPLDSAGLAIVLQTRAGAKDLYRSRGDVFLFFFDIYWSADNKLAIITCGNPSLRIAYDVQRSRSLEFQHFEVEMAQVIRQNYNLTKMRDPKSVLDWACKEEGRNAFLERFPSAISRF